MEAPVASKTQTVAELILEALTRTKEALSSADFTERLELEPGDTVVHRAISALLKDGRLVASGTKPGKRGAIIKLYRLAPSDSAPAWPIPPREPAPAPEIQTVRYPLSAIMDEDMTHALDTVAASANGDELHGIAPIESPPTSTDPIIRALSRMDTREPRFQEGAMHVDRIRAMATHLDDGKPITPQMDVIAYLFDLAKTIEQMTD